MEEIKLLFLKQLLQSENINMLVKAMRKLLEGTRNCYAGLSNKSLTKTTDDDLVEMMVIDGAFLVQVFRKIENIDQKEENIFNSKWDVLAMENQIPLNGPTK